MTLSVRFFAIGDQPATRGLILAGLGEHFSPLDPNLNPDLNDIYASYNLEGHFFVVAEVAGAIVGTGGLLLNGAEKVGRIVRVSVRSDLRGRGIGRAIVEHLLDLARQARISRIVVETNHDWHPALALYQSCGFAEYDRDEESIHLEQWLY
ncbi:MAG: GNAT family N-acetyltransferase [Candidatus Promineifilaceae bacterium]